MCCNAIISLVINTRVAPDVAALGAMWCGVVWCGVVQMSDDRGKSDRELRNAYAPPSLNWGVFYPPL